ncbi:MAG: hypothetical protein RLZZ282_1070 [Verrucomicrobiota bacterium]
MLRTVICSIHDRWANLHLIIRFTVLAVLLGGGGLYALKPSYRAFKGWRLERNLVAARVAMDTSQMDEARDLSLTVLQSGDPCIEAFRILEKSTASLRDPRHGDIARALISHPEGTDEDRLNGFSGMVLEMPLGVVGQAWAALPAACQKDPRFALTFSGRLLAERRLGEAASVLLGVPEEARDGAVNRGLIRVLIRSGKREGFEEAQRLVASNFPADAAASSAWLDLLEEIPAASLQENLLGPVRSRLAELSAGDPARVALMLARMDYAGQFARRAAVLEAAVSRWKDGAPERVAAFLSQLGLHSLLLDSVPVARVGEHPGLFPLLLDALEKTEAWEQIPALLDSHGLLIPKAEELAHRAVLVFHTANASGLNHAWAAAIDEAKASPQVSVLLLKLHRLAADAGMAAEAEQALVEAIRLGRGALPLYADVKPLLASLQQQGRENVLLEICAIYLRFEPSNPVLLTQYAYLACLNDLADPATVLKALLPMAEAFPKEKPIQLVLATVHLCAGQNERAATILEPLQLDFGSLPPSYRATLLASRILNRSLSKTDSLVTGFPWKSLLPSERKKFSELIRTADP